MKKLIPQSIKNIYHLFQAVLANVWYGFPSRRLKVIGVTGTNGKTTTVQMIAKILEEAGFPEKPDGHGASKISVASTINFKIGEKEWVNDTKFTTLSSWKLQKHLRQAVEAGCEYAIIEVTSHALDQNRIWGVDFNVAVVTNVTREHLDYHETMEEYAMAKGKLFRMVSRDPDGIAVVNLNMDFAEKFLRCNAEKKFGYFLETQNPKCIIDKELKLEIARDTRLSISGSEFSINGQNFKLNLPGEFNVENALAATCVGLSQEIPLDKISQALSKMKGVPGRMERIENDRGLEIIVDYAVTPDSLEKLYEYINKLKKENTKVIAVFGSCGERDRGKRPIMGEIVAKRADYCIVTNEDPYNEDPQRIIDEVFSGVIQSPAFPLLADARNSSKPDFSKSKVENVNAWRILERREAIKKALRLAEAGDIVVVTGKGAEEIMAVGDKRIPWNDPKVIRKVLREPG